MDEGDRIYRKIVHNGSSQRQQVALNSAPAAFIRPLSLNC